MLYTFGLSFFDDRLVDECRVHNDILQQRLLTDIKDLPPGNKEFKTVMITGSWIKE